jgi:pimeloyl-ACP methyl ester carboxylesterase
MSRYFSDAHTSSALNKELSCARRSSQFLRALALLLLVGMCEGIFTSTCSGQASPRPVVFVHGVMGDSAGWGDQTDPQNLRGNLISRLASSSLGYTNTANYEVYYDGIAVLYSVTGNPQDDRLAVESIPASARFFTIRFYSNNSADPFNKVDATKISILNKASELAHVLEAISQITHVQESVLVAHSQGGLVARAYLENLGSANPCNEILYQTPCIPGEVAYAQNVAHVITLDSPFGGGDYSGFITAVVSLTSTFLGETPINTFELRPDSVVLRAINYQSGVAGILPQPLPSSVTIDSIVSYLSDLGYPCPDDSSLTCFSDDVVESRSQAIRQNIAPAQLTPNLVDLGNPISANDPQITQVRGILIGLGGCWPALPGSPFPPPSGVVPQGVLLHSISCTGHVTSTQDAIYQSVFAHAQGVTTTVTVQATLDGSLYTGPVNYQLVNQGVLGTRTRHGVILV